MKWSAQAEWFGQRAAIGKPPKAWLERTEVLHHLVGVFDAFFDLSPSRAVHMGGEGFIPLVEIDAYCRMAGIDGVDERMDFMRLIRAMDAEWLTSRVPKDAKAER